MRDEDGGVTGGLGALGGRAPWWWVVACAAVLVGLVCVAFWPAMGAYYVGWDDKQNFVENEMWRGLGPENLRWMLTTFHMGHWHPVTWLSFGIQWELIGGHPAASHGVNIGLQALNAVLFMLVVRRVLGGLERNSETGRRGVSETARQRDRGRPEQCCAGYSKLVVIAAGLGAAFFAVHPLRVESVAWATERRDLLSAAFLLMAVLAYLRAVAGGSGARRVRWGWFAAAVALHVLSCGSKAWGMSFFVVLMALDMYPLRRVEGLRGWFTRGGWRVLLEKSPFGVIGLLTAVMASKAVTQQAAKTLEEWGVVDRLVQACYGLMFYLKQTVAPSGHSALYELPVEVNPLEARYLAAYAVVVALGVAGVVLWRRARGFGVGLFIYLVQVSPVLGLLQSGDQFVADRYSYLATMPLAVGLAWVCVWGLERAERARGPEGVRPVVLGVAGAAIALIGGLVFLSRAQTRVWNNNLTLWEHAAAVTPTHTVLYYLGGFLKERDPARAAGLFRRSADMNPRFGLAWYEYAKLAHAGGDLREAERAYVEASKYLVQQYVAHVDLGVMYYVQGRREEAVRQYELAVASVERADEVDKQGRPYMVMGLAMLDMGRRDEAAAWFRKALGFVDTREGAAGALREMGMTP